MRKGPAEAGSLKGVTALNSLDTFSGQKEKAPLRAKEKFLPQVYHACGNKARVPAHFIVCPECEKSSFAFTMSGRRCPECEASLEGVEGTEISVEVYIDPLSGDGFTKITY